ncbi:MULTISPECIES: hypothetical protein [Aurantimonas]|uniref:hypothetical protein n=1 Tax=Aurantimonas TaxID=182269 RepID=UPI0035176C3A
MTQPKDGDEALHKLLNAIQDRQITVFSVEEAEALREVAKVWRAARSSAWLASVLGSGLKWAAGIVVLWIAFKNGLAEWLQGLLSS